jgi:hypothetical protein
VLKLAGFGVGAPNQVPTLALHLEVSDNLFTAAWNVTVVPPRIFQDFTIIYRMAELQMTSPRRGRACALLMSKTTVCAVPKACPMRS